jgi:hypothetical protein
LAVKGADRARLSATRACPIADRMGATHVPNNPAALIADPGLEPIVIALRQISMTHSAPPSPGSALSLRTGKTAVVRHIFTPTFYN